MGAWYHCLYELGYLIGVILGLFVPTDYFYLSFLVAGFFGIVTAGLLALKF